MKAHVRGGQCRRAAFEGLGSELGEAGLHALSYLSLLRFHLLLPGLDQILLELFIGSARPHDLFHLVFGVLDNLIGPLLLSLQQLDPIVQAQHIELDLVTTLADLRDRHQVLL